VIVLNDVPSEEAVSRTRPLSDPFAELRPNQEAGYGLELTHRAQRFAVERTEPVATYLAFHEVDDVEHWLSSPKREEIFGPMGITARTFHDPEGSKRAGLIVEILDMAAFQEFMQSDGGRRDEA
jgi:hypothetical protein